MKKCIDCKLEQTNDNFPFDKSRNRHLSVCKKCTSNRTEVYRQKHPDKWRQYDKNRNSKIKELVLGWKSQGCTKCGDKREYIIDAHHLDPSLKEYSIGDASASFNKIELELKKCIPLCRNCHAEFHHLEKKNRITIQDYLNIKIKTHQNQENMDVKAEVSKVLIQNINMVAAGHGAC
jgi:hypothetical protein